MCILYLQNATRDFTVAILAQGTHWAVAVTQAFFIIFCSERAVGRGGAIARSVGASATSMWGQTLAQSWGKRALARRCGRRTLAQRCDTQNLAQRCAAWRNLAQPGATLRHAQPLGQAQPDAAWESSWGKSPLRESASFC